MNERSEVTRLLGLRVVVSDYPSLIRRGLSAAAFKRVIEASACTRQRVIKSMKLSERTLARRLNAREHLKPESSERVLRLARVLIRAEDVFEAKEKAQRWIDVSNVALGGQTPLECLDTGDGFQLVLDLLGRIEHGVHS